MDVLGSPGEVLPYLITHHLTESGILYGIVGAGALAAAMSSSDAITHGASVSFGRDICKVIFPSLKENQELWIMRGAVVGVGGIAYCIAIYGSDGLIKLLLGAYGAIVQIATCSLFRPFLEESFCFRSHIRINYRSYSYNLFPIRSWQFTL